jgi:hypothetical protein
MFDSRTISEAELEEQVLAFTMGMDMSEEQLELVSIDSVELAGQSPSMQCQTLWKELNAKGE